MKTGILAIIFFLLASHKLSSQTTITGLVTDSLNNPVPFASVYLSKTSIGTYTDNNGVYSLIITQGGPYEMIVSCIGYKLSSQIINAEGKKLTIDIKLITNVIRLNEVTIRSTDRNRRKNYAQFIKSFIGETNNALNCKITNPEDLRLNRGFYKDSENNILKGQSIKPLIIENRALGYNIYYDLVDFNYDYETGLTKFSGYNYFQPLTGTLRINRIRERNRSAAWYGSRMHFLRALFSDSMSRENYTIYEYKTDAETNILTLIKPIHENDLKFSSGTDLVKLFYSNPLLINYADKHPELYSENWVNLTDDNIRVYANIIVSYDNNDLNADPEQSVLRPKDRRSTISFSDTVKLFKNGYYYGPYSIIWRGKMANERIADMLPLDFAPDENGKVKYDTIFKSGNMPSPAFIETESTQVAEKVYLHIDRVLYNSGEDIWFKAYVIDPSTNRLSVNTSNLHVELIASDSKIIMSRTLRINRGLGNGDFHLNDSVPSGRYRIRAYTNYMRNYDEQFFFLKEITVVNPYDEVQGLNKSRKKIENNIDITFFPEGGSLVDNVVSKVAYKVVDALGKGCDAEVKLYTPSGELIAGFNSAHNGLGTFSIKPVPGYNYYTVIKSKDGTEVKAEFPQSFKTGVSIRTVVTPNKKLILTVSTNEATLPLLDGKDLSVTLSSRNLINNRTNIRINSLMNNFSIPLDKMPDGIIRITLSGAEGLSLCERLVFVQKNSDVRLNISTDKNSYKPREKVNAEISLTGDSIFTGAGEFSFSAAEQRFTDNSSAYPSSIASWFLLESDVRGTVEEPSYYFDPDNKKRLQDLDLLLMTQGWRDFKWKYDSLSAFNHETGFTLSGKVKRMININPIEDAKINLGLFSADSKEFLETKSDKNGSFKFENLFINGITEAIMSSTDKYENALGRIFVDPVKHEPPVFEKIKPDTIELSLITKDYSSLQQEAIIKLNNLKKYKLSDTLNLGEVFITAKKAETAQEIKVKESRRVYSVPDKEIKISQAAENYIGDVLSFISGRIGGVRVVRGLDPCSIYYPDDADVFIREQFIMEKVKCGGKTITIRRGALILLDGYEVNPANLSSVLTLPMNIVDRIDVLNASPLYGVRGANGVINIITLTGIKRAPEILSPNSAYTIVNGFDVQRIFYSPKFDNKSEQTLLPDYRSTIFWEPNIKVEKNRKSTLQYFNADNPAKISIVVEGITEEGIPVTGRTSYEVR